MEAVLVVLRPKPHITVSADFRAKAFDILLTEEKTQNVEKGHKQLPKTVISFESEPAEALCNFVYNLTGAEFGGLKGKRAVFVPPSGTEPYGEQESFVKGTLYCVPVDTKDKLNGHVLDNLPLSPGFYSLDLILERLGDNDSPSLTKQTKAMLYRLESYLMEKHHVPGAMDLLFSICTEDRLKRSITNPAYLSGSQSGLGSNYSENTYSRTVANEALAKMMSIEKCDLTVINPLFGSDMSYKTKVETVVVNKYWGLGKPDYSKITAAPSPSLQRGTKSNWLEDCPMHKAAHEGDAEAIKDLIKNGYSVTTKDQESWAPIHYAACAGHLKAISVILNEGECSPNITNDNGSTPLHLAASRGRVYVVELLLNHQEIDVNMVDAQNLTALNLCEQVDKADSQSCAKLLLTAMNRPTPTIQVSLMDGTYRSLSLLSGANTTVQQLHGQMMTELNMPESCSHLFTIWICSRNLQLQLKPDHKPIQHLNDWKRKIVAMLTEHEPTREDPQLFWRRDAILSIDEERKVKHPVALNLLFFEAYHNYIKSMYPCAEQDAIILGGILMQLHHGDFDTRRTNALFSNDRALHTLVPQTKLRSTRRVDWASKIKAQYRHYSQNMANRDRSPQILQQHFLQICWNLTVYGAAFFTGFLQIKNSREPMTVYIGVNDLGVHVINSATKMMQQSFNYKEIVWHHKDNQPILEIKHSGSTKGGMSILTKQASAICTLMRTITTQNQTREEVEQLKSQIKAQQAAIRQQGSSKEGQSKFNASRDLTLGMSTSSDSTQRLREWHHRVRALKDSLSRQRYEGLDLLPHYQPTTATRERIDVYDLALLDADDDEDDISLGESVDLPRSSPSDMSYSDYFRQAVEEFTKKSVPASQMGAISAYVGSIEPSQSQASIGKVAVETDRQYNNSPDVDFQDYAFLQLKEEEHHNITFM